MKRFRSLPRCARVLLSAISMLALTMVCGCARSPDRECPSTPAPLLCGPDGTAVCDDPCGCLQCDTPFDLLEVDERSYLCTQAGCYFEVRSEREFQAIETSGMTSRAGACDRITDGEVTLRFVLMADDGTAIRAGETLYDEVVDLGSDAVRFSEAAIFEGSEGPCTADECAQPAVMQCLVAPGIPEAAKFRRCQQPTEVSPVGAPVFDSDISQPQLFGVLYENSGSREGWLPSDVGALFPDWDGDGIADGADDPGQIPSRASDLNRQGLAGLAVLVNNWESTHRGAPHQQRQTSFGLWEFNDGAGADATSLLDGGDVWTSDPAVATSARLNFESVGSTRANVYRAMNQVLTEAYGDSAFAAHRKMLVVFVDGPDDLRLPGEDADSVIANATAAGARIFIVHLDASRDETAPTSVRLFRDDPRYWNSVVDGAAIQAPCSDESSCKNFEVCRVPTGFATAPNAPVDIDPMGNRYCMPDRHPDTGRLGPIADYARIACETDGGYIYVREASGLRPRMDWLPFAVDGMWKVDAVVEALASGELERDRAYALQTTVSAVISDVDRQFSFSQTGEPITTDDCADTRAVLFD